MKYPLLCAAALLSACGPSTERAATTAPRKPAAATAAFTPSADSAKATAPPEPTGRAWQLLPIGAQVGPQPLAVDTVGAVELREMREQFGEPAEFAKGRWLAFADQYLLYRAAPRDTVWLSWPLTLDEAYDVGERGDITLTEVNLDGRGAPEAVVSIYSEVNGSGGGSRWRTLNVIDVTRQQLLLQTTLADFTEAFGGYALLHGDTLTPEEMQEGCERTAQVRGREVRIGGAYDVYDTTKPCQLPGLRAGHYRYRGGRMYYRAGP